MRSIFTKTVSIITLALMLALSLHTEAYAYSEQPDWFDFSETVLKMDAGTTHDINFYSKYDYTYYLGPHTSAATYLECSFKAGTQKVRLHIGPDETVKNVFFYFYVDDRSIGMVEIFDCVEVYVQKIDPAAQAAVAADAAAKEALKTYKGNTAEFNAMYYYYNYKDLRDAFGMDPDKLLEHWNTFGKNEHRIANRFL